MAEFQKPEEDRKCENFAQDVDDRAPTRKIKFYNI